MSVTEGAEGQLISVVRIYQLVAAGLLLLATYIINRKYFLFIFAIAIAVAPSLNTLGDAVYFPNQAGIRYIPFLLGINFLIWATRYEKSGILLFSTISALLLFLNPETGVALFCGFAVFLILVKYKPKSAYSTTFITAGLFILLTLVMFALLSKFLIPLLYKSTSTDLLSSMELFASGYGGLVRKPATLAALSIFFALFALIRGVLRAKRGFLTRIDAFQAAMGVIILMWLPYYINRMDRWNLWFQAILILLLFAPRINLSSFKILSRKNCFGAFYSKLAVALMTGLIFASAHIAWKDGTKYYISYKPNCDAPSENVNGLCYTDRKSTEKIAQIKFLKSLTEKKDYLILSHLPALIRLMGFNEGLPWYDPYGEITYEKDMKSITSWIEKNGPRYIVVAAATSKISINSRNRASQLQQIAHSLKSYRKDKTISEWEVYRRISQ